MSSESKDAVTALGPVIQRYQAAVDDFDRETARLLGVNRTDQRCLEVLAEAADAGVSPRDIADRLGLTTGSVTTMLDRLEAAHYVTRRRHPNDGRRLVVALTPTARERIWTIIGPHIADSAAAVSERFTVAELDTVARFLGVVTDIQDAHVAALRERAPFPALSRSTATAAD